LHKRPRQKPNARPSYEVQKRSLKALSIVPIGDILGSVPTIRFDCLASRLQCPLWVDTVDKVGDEQRAGNNRIQVPRFLNQCCAPDSYLESMLLTRPSKNLFRQHRSLADITARSSHVRFAPKSGHSSVRVGCPKSAISRHPTSTEARWLPADSQDGVLRKSCIDKQHGGGRSGASSAG
jgi:hypothetical protein